MTSISNLTSSGYYSLNNQSSGGAGVASSVATPRLADVLAAEQQKQNGAADNSYALDLSPSALEYIKRLNEAAGDSVANVVSNATTSYTLTRDQQAKVNEIIEQYKDAPFTQATFDQIQDALNQAGLNEKTLQAQEKARSFNTTQFLLDALNGGGGEDMTLSSLTGKGNSDEAEALGVKQANFMRSVADAWARISTTVSNG